jgi:hypothetical protein
MDTQASRNRSFATVRSARVSRAGMSILEFVGCSLALVGGLWLGAIYLGVDVRQATYVALADSKLMDTVPESWRPEGMEQTKEPTSAELAASVQNELVSLREEITTLRDTPESSAAVATTSVEASKSATANADDAAKQATIEYWTKLTEVVRSQALLQVEAETAATAGNATKVAELKARISRFSASGIRALPTANVDPTAVKLGQELADWYEQGASLYDQAVQVWESPGRGQSGQQITQEWERTQVQHANEGRLMMERIAAVRDSLTRRFGEGFAPIAGI